MRIWADIYRAGAKRSPGPVWSLTGAQVVRMLDGAGSVTIDAPGTDRRANDLLQNDDTMVVYVEQDGVVREMGRGIIRRIKYMDGASGWTISADGPDELAELKNFSVLLGRSYNNVTLAALAEDLIGLAAGWSVDVDAAVAGRLVTARFDGVSVLRALQYICEEQGLHLRQAVGSKTVEIGAFGTPAALFVYNAEMVSAEIYDNDAIALIESTNRSLNSEDLANWVLPVGGGEGAAALTLENSTRTEPYPIQTMTGPDGSTLYYIATGATPVRQQVGVFKEISPIANTEAAKELAANALYDAAVAWLERNSVRQETLRVVVKKCTQVVRAGDKIRLTYKGLVIDEDGVYVYRDIDAEYWVLRASERAGGSGVSLDLEVSNVDRVALDAAEVVVGAIETLKVRNLKPQPFPAPLFGYGYDFIQGDNAIGSEFYKEAEFRFKIDSSFTDIIKLTLQIKTTPLFATAQHGPVLDVITYYVATVTKSVIYPKTLRMKINGVDVTSELGGPWSVAPTNAAVDLTFDISDYVLNASGGLYREHLVAISAEGHTGNGAYPGWPSATTGLASNGIVFFLMTGIAIGQAIK